MRRENKKITPYELGPNESLVTVEDKNGTVQVLFRKGRRFAHFPATFHTHASKETQTEPVETKSAGCCIVM